MRSLGNILWHFPFLGFMNAIATYLLGLLLLVIVIAAPIGRGLMEFGKFPFAPYSRAMVKESALRPGKGSTTGSRIWKTYSTIISFVYVLLLGIPLSLIAIFQIAGLFITIVGIPVAIVMAKSLGTYFNPVGKKCVPVAVVQELERRRAQKYLAQE